jgi:hypothetical protein
MTVYLKRDIEALSQRLEARADSIINATPSAAQDMKAAAMLLRLLTALTEIDRVETGPAATLHDGSRVN